jgi:protein TilB
VENVYKKDNDPDKNNPNKYTKEYRRKLYKEIEEEKMQKEKEKDSKKRSPWDPEPPQGPHSVYKNNGEIRVCNQGKYDFYLNEDIFVSGITLFELKLPKYLQTTQINVDLNPQYIRVVVKDKVTQLKFCYEIIVEKSVIQRSTTTGHLVIKCPILGYENKWDGIDLGTYNEEEYKVFKKKQNESKKKKEKEAEMLDVDNMLKEKNKTQNINYQKKNECNLFFKLKIFNFFLKI